MSHLLAIVILSQAAIQPLAVEADGGVVVTADGAVVNLQPGDCIIPASRCVSYVQQAEACFAEAEKPKATQSATPWLIVVAAVLGIAAGMAAAQAIK